MLTGITYNCNPESLGDVSEAEFVEAFENEVMSVPRWRELAVKVTFDAGVSEVTVFVSDDWEADISHEPQLREEFACLAERAFSELLG